MYQAILSSDILLLSLLFFPLAVRSTSCTFESTAVCAVDGLEDCLVDSGMCTCLISMSGTSVLIASFWILKRGWVLEGWSEEEVVDLEEDDFLLR
jgi:hypothetical protein